MKLAGKVNLIKEVRRWWLDMERSRILIFAVSYWDAKKIFSLAFTELKKSTTGRG